MLRRLRIDAGGALIEKPGVALYSNPGLLLECRVTSAFGGFFGDVGVPEKATRCLASRVRSARPNRESLSIWMARRSTGFPKIGLTWPQRSPLSAKKQCLGILRNP